jgi:DNA gyrase subunit A
MSIRFPSNAVRSMGRPSVGVRGIRLADDDACISMTIVSSDAPILTVTSKGYGKRTKPADYRVQGRGGRGIFLMKLTEKNGEVVATRPVNDEQHVMLITNAGTLIRMRCVDIPIIGRNTQGVRLVRVDANERVQALANLVADEDEETVEIAKPLETVAEDAGDADLPDDPVDPADDEPADDAGA